MAHWWLFVSAVLCINSFTYLLIYLIPPDLTGSYKISDLTRLTGHLSDNQTYQQLCTQCPTWQDSVRMRCSLSVKHRSSYHLALAILSFNWINSSACRCSISALINHIFCKTVQQTSRSAARHATYRSNWFVRTSRTDQDIWGVRSGGPGGCGGGG